MTMCVHAPWTILLYMGLGITGGGAYTDLDRCITKGESDLGVFNEVYCLETKNDVDVACVPNTNIVLTSLQFALKASTDVCMKRVLRPGHLLCCVIHETDVLYDANCLQDIWNPEDTHHYRRFMGEVLRKCSNTSHCVLNSDMFTNLQREIPRTRKYSSYFQISYQCIEAPTVKAVTACSSKSVTQKEIHYQGIHASNKKANRTCKCRVTTRTDAKVKVKAVDVRTDFVLRSDTIVNNFTKDQLPLFGFQELITAQYIDLSVKNGSIKAGDSLWLHLSGTNGRKVNIYCGTRYDEKFNPSKPTSIYADGASTGSKDSADWGYWPVLYVSAGAGFTLVLISCILVAIFICRRRKQRRQPPRRPQSVRSSTQGPGDYQQGASISSYATLLVDIPYKSGSNVVRSTSSPKVIGRASGQGQGQIQSKGYDQRQSQIQTKGYGQSQVKCQDQGQVQMKGYSQGQGQGQSQHPTKGYSHLQTKGYGQLQNKGYGQLQTKSYGQNQGQGQSQGHNQTKGYSQGQGQVKGYGQSQVKGQTQGQSLDQSKAPQETKVDPKSTNQNQMKSDRHPTLPPPNLPKKQQEVEGRTRHSAPSTSSTGSGEYKNQSLGKSNRSSIPSAPPPPVPKRQGSQLSMSKGSTHQGSQVSVDKGSTHGGSQFSVDKGSTHQGSAKSIGKASTHQETDLSVNKGSTHQGSDLSVNKGSAHHQSVPQLGDRESRSGTSRSYFVLENSTT